MAWYDIFKRAAPAVEKRSAGSGFTAEVMRFREAYISGRTGLGELTGTVSSCVGLWQNGFALADVQGTDLLDRRTMAMLGRSLALRGEFVALMDGDQLVPASDWDTRTRNGQPVAYRLSIPEAGGGRSMTALAGEVLHVRINADPAAPWLGVSPLRTASLSAGMLHSVETALSEVFQNAPIGSQVVPFPENPETDNTALANSFIGKHGRIILRESVAVTAAGGPTPQTDWRPSDLTPDLEHSMAVETLNAAQASIFAAYGVLPSLFASAATGPQTREAQRHLAQWTLQPLAELLAEEASEKLGSAVSIDTMLPTQAFDAGGSARAFATLIQGLAMAKEAGVDAKAALAMLDWEKA
ncbi:phage portal protein [Nitrobacter sp.]|uniref:phage portal protein n=1 Tax=Nitrobacter sp. TaxID=29420 RepID=UPI0029CAB529|nr:phage portal protein [Nitrobacter sp.]